MYIMKHYKVSEARARLGDLLDEAERGDAVVIERHGVRFTLSAERPSSRASARPLFASVDPDVMSGQWTWAFTARGLRFRARRGR
jgi:antitoxin (DNA-binding transcriptional repressor) of toxin-antitoxin stability system